MESPDKLYIVDTTLVVLTVTEHNAKFYSAEFYSADGRLIEKIKDEEQYILCTEFLNHHDKPHRFEKYTIDVS